MRFGKKVAGCVASLLATTGVHAPSAQNGDEIASLNTKLGAMEQELAFDVQR
jgi:hypothetical protein